MSDIHLVPLILKPHGRVLKAPPLTKNSGTSLTDSISWLAVVKD